MDHRQDRPAWATRLQAERRAREWSKFETARRLYAAVGRAEPSPGRVKSLARQITRHEAGQHFPTEWGIAYATVYEIPQHELLPAPSPDPSAAPARTVDGGITPDLGDDMERRLMLQLGILGLGAGALGSTETVRQLLDLAVDGADRPLADWQLACTDHLHALRTRPAAQVRDALLIDLLALHRQVTTTTDAQHTLEFRRFVAALSMLQAHALSRLGDHGPAVHWWRTARGAADATGDLDLRLMIRCEEAGVGLYGQRDLHTVLHLVDTAEQIAGDAPSFWKADLAGTRAKALSLLGRHDEARHSLHDFTGYGGPDARAAILPTIATGSQPYFAASWVHANEGNETAADTARDEVLARNRDWQYGSNVRLHEALCTVVNGGTDQGARLAATVLDTLPAAYRTNMITYTGGMVLNRVPPDQRQRPAVRELREVLATTAPRPAPASVT